MLPEQIHANQAQVFGMRPSHAPQQVLEAAALLGEASTGPMQSRQMTQSQHYLSSQHQQQPVMGATLHQQQQQPQRLDSQQTYRNLAKLLSKQEEASMEIPLEFLQPSSLTNYNT